MVFGRRIMKFVHYGLAFLLCLLLLTSHGCVPSLTSGFSQAETLVAEKDYQGAIDLYQEVINTKAGTTQARQAQLAMGELYLRVMEQADKGIGIYKQLTVDAPESDETAEAYYRIGIHAFKTEKYKEAGINFELIVNRFPQLEISNKAQLMLAKSFEKAKQFEKATETYDQFAARNPKSERAADALMLKAKIQKNHLGADKDAERTYQQVVKKYGRVQGLSEQLDAAKVELKSMGAFIPRPDDPTQTPVGQAMERQRRRIERDRPKNAERSRAIAGMGQDSGFGVTAEEVMASFGTIQGDDQGTFYDAMLMIANMNLQEENYRDAGALYFRAIELAKADQGKIDPYAYLRLSICYRKIGMSIRAQELMRQAIRKDKEVLNAVVRAGESQYANEEYEKAIETYKSVVGFNRKMDPEIYWRVALAHKKMKDVGKEVEYLERAVVASPDYEDALQSLAEALNYRMKERTRAGYYQDLVEGKGNSYEVQIELAEVSNRYGQHSKAKSRYNNAARIAQRELEKAENQADKSALENKILQAKIQAAITSYEIGKPEDGSQIIQALAESNPDHAMLDYATGQIAKFNDDSEGAISAFTIALGKNPRLSVAAVALSELYLKLDQRDQAVSTLEKYLSQNRYDRQTRKKLNALKNQSKESSPQ